MTDREKFVSICQAIWGKEWQRQAAVHLGVAVRTIVYWANLGHEPREGWAPIFKSLRSGCTVALAEIKNRQSVLNRFYNGGGL